MLTDFSELSMPKEEAARNQVLLTFLDNQRKKNPSGSSQWYCTLIQFARDLNRKHPGALDIASFLTFAKKKWPAR